ncbi:HEL047Cp [Eremothecium sinecaudum]|uniref:HEL047Cp n=1 Tax=Eremothecium sinecaudum TaxID=45286 RepID=A0A0X8HTQ0_9SACH|nr:HEL047Cp [Eremothecium sinecaudum]AMD21233.1 HEL047Cp [Eremothecium sinecaudum]
MSHSATPRKRGRPSILKGYPDPMKSPMAYSSLQVQKSNQCFNKPLMRIPTATTSPARFKSPVKKQYSGSSKLMFVDESLRGAANEGSDGAASKQAPRFRGIVMNTPKKSVGGIANSSSPITPSDQLFSSVSRNQLRSSPPAMVHDDFSSPLKKRCVVGDGRAELEGSRLGWNADATVSSDGNGSGFKFVLCIDKEGKACISDCATSAPSAVAAATKTEKQDVASITDSNKRAEGIQDDSVVKFDKKRVLGLLKQMSKRSGLRTEDNGSESGAPGVVMITGKQSTLKDPEHAEFPVCPPPAPPNSAAVPMTPRCSSVFQFKTGFTPCHMSIGELLTSTPPKGPNCDKLTVPTMNTPSINNACGYQQDHYVFKLSSGDPLLMNDEYSEMLAQVSDDPSELLQILTSPKRTLCFNTPPSYLSAESPRKPSLMKPDGQLHTNSANAVTRIDDQPSTPTATMIENTTTTLQCTPLIQQAMSGAYAKQHLLPTMEHYGMPSEDGSITVSDKRTLTVELDDARLALKKLIKGE